MSEGSTGVLALDLGRALGYAYGPVGAPSPIADFLTLDGGASDKKALPEIGAIMNQAMNGLDDLFARFKPAVVGIEDAIPQRDNSARTARVTLGLHALVDMICFQNGLTLANGKVMRPTVDRVRAQVCGRARLTSLERAIKPKVTVKEMIVEPWIARVGWKMPDDHNCRDAAVLWAYCAAHIARQGYRRA